MPIKTNSFESIENLGKKAGQMVRQTATVVGGDIAEQFGLKEIPKEEKQEIKKEEKKKVDYLTAQITQIRQKKEQKQVQVKQEKKQEAQSKFFEKKKKESLLSKVIKSQQGTKEGVNRVGG